MKDLRGIAILFLLMLVAYSCYTQSALLDTLKYIEEDTSKLLLIKENLNDTVYASPSESLMIAEAYDSLAQEINDSTLLVDALVLKGMAYYVNADYDNSIESYIEALNLKKHFDKPSEIARVYNNLATTYQVGQDLDNSIKYFRQALDIYKEERDSLWIANTSGNLGLLLLNNKKLEEAEPLINTALDYYVITGNKVYEGFTRLNLANLQVEKGDYKKSISSYEQSLRLVPESINPVVSLAANSGIGVAYSRLNDYKNGEKYLQLGLAKSEAVGYNEQTIVCHDELSQLYENSGNYKLAHKHQKQYIIIKDSVFTKEQDDKMIEALTKYESDIKEQKIALLNAEQKVADAKLAGSKNLLLVLSIGLLVLCGLLYWLYKLNQANKKAATEKDTLLREIHHRVKNNLQVISALLTLQSKYVKEDTAIEALKEGQDRVHSMALIHKDLYQHDNLKGVNTKDYLEKLIQNLISSYNISEEKVRLELDIESIWLDVDTMIPLGLMINELVSNALKHAFKVPNNGLLKISLKEIHDELHLAVSDTGPGLDNTSIESKGGFGKSLIRSFSKKLNADISYKNNNGLSVEMKIKEYKKAA